MTCHAYPLYGAYHIALKLCTAVCYYPATVNADSQSDCLIVAVTLIDAVFEFLFSTGMYDVKIFHRKYAMLRAFKLRRMRRACSMREKNENFVQHFVRKT